MESIYFSEELELLRDQVRRFVDEHVRPHGEQWEQDGRIDRALYRTAGDLGLLGLRHAEDHGGAGADALASVVWSEELGRSTFGGVTASLTVHTDMASPHISHAGNAEQRARWLPGVCTGEVLTAVAVTEPGAGSDVAALRTRARRDGDDWVLDGAKVFITNGVYADLYILAARTDPDAKPSRGISLFLIEAGTPGLEVARKLDKMGWRSSDTAELRLDSCRVPGSHLLGEENRGFYGIMQGFQNERLVIGAIAVGEAQTALDLTLDYVKTRRAFGGRLFDRESIRQRLAMRWAEVAAARELVYRTAWLDSRGHECVREVSMLKALSGELLNQVLYDCVQFHGGMGYMRESAIERMYRDARVIPIGGGATEVMLEEAAKRLEDL